MTFEVTYRDLKGRPKTDVFLASNQSVLYATLQLKGILPISMREIDDVDERQTAKARPKVVSRMNVMGVIALITIGVTALFLWPDKNDKSRVALTQKSLPLQTASGIQKNSISVQEDDSTIEPCLSDHVSGKKAPLDTEKVVPVAAEPEIPEGEIEGFFGSEGGALTADPILLPAQTPMFFSVANKPQWVKIQFKWAPFELFEYREVPNRSFSSSQEQQILFKVIVDKNETGKPRCWSTIVTVDNVGHTIVVYQSERVEASEISTCWR